jgi:hypothetical protein
MPGIKTQALSCAARSLVTIPTALSRLLSSHHKNFPNQSKVKNIKVLLEEQMHARNVLESTKVTDATPKTSEGSLKPAENGSITDAD